MKRSFAQYDLFSFCYHHMASKVGVGVVMTA